MALIQRLNPYGHTLVYHPRIGNQSRFEDDFARKLRDTLATARQVANAFAISSTICCSIVIVTCIVFFFINKELVHRPSFRLSLSIAVSDIMYAVCQLFVNRSEYMSRLPEMRLRAILWIMDASTVSFVLLSTCIGVQLLLTVLLKKVHIARRLQKWYEIFSFAFALLATHPNLYIYQKVTWFEKIQTFHIASDTTTFYTAIWLMVWMWVFSCIIFLFFVVLLTYIKLSNLWGDGSVEAPEKVDFSDAHSLASPHGSSNRNGVMYMADERAHYVRSVTLRIACYPLIPVVTLIWLVAGNMSVRPPLWLAGVAFALPPIQGTFNFLVFLVNPAFDIYRRRLPLFKHRRPVSDMMKNYTEMNDLSSDSARNADSTLALNQNSH